MILICYHLLVCKEVINDLILNYPPSFIFRYLERLVRSLVYLPWMNSVGVAELFCMYRVF